MNKYYINLGEHCLLKVADTPMKACMVVFRDTISSGYVDCIPLHFRVSTRGHEEHDDDIILETKLIIEELIGVIPDPGECCEKCGMEFLSEETRHKAYHTLSSDSDARQPIEICERCHAKLQPSG